MALNRQSRLTFLLALFLIYCDVTAAAAANAAAGTSQCGAATRPLDAAPSNSILVVGSVNVDIITEVDRLPRQDENIMARSPKMVIAVGGKGRYKSSAKQLPVYFTCRGWIALSRVQRLAEVRGLCS